MSERNPDAPSKASLGDGPSGGTGRVAAWRDGNVVVMLAGGEIPHRCVKCNEPADEPTKERTLYWYNPWLYLLVLISILVFAIVALIVRKKAVVSAGLCADHKRRRRTALIVAWIGVLAGTLLLLLGVTESSRPHRRGRHTDRDRCRHHAGPHRLPGAHRQRLRSTEGLRRALPRNAARVPLLVTPARRPACSVEHGPAGRLRAP